MKQVLNFLFGHFSFVLEEYRKILIYLLWSFKLWLAFNLAFLFTILFCSFLLLVLISADLTRWFESIPRLFSTWFYDGYFLGFKAIRIQIVLLIFCFLFTLKCLDE